MVEFRVTYVENEGGERRLKRWSTVEEARAFIAGLKRGAPVHEIKLVEIVEGKKPRLLPLSVANRPVSTPPEGNGPPDGLGV